MRKVPTLFARDPEDRRFVIPQVALGCEWVLAGEGTATRKYDGVTFLFDPALDADYLSRVPELQGWWRRVDPKPTETPPAHFHPVAFDENTGKTFGWAPADASGFARWAVEAVRNLTDGPREGTHELLGPKINRDPERIGKHVLIAHADADLLDAPRDYEGLARWLRAQPYEGIVWHHPDGRMAKLKRKDVRR